jgi:hypothetical protein
VGPLRPVNILVHTEQGEQLLEERRQLESCQVCQQLGPKEQLVQGGHGL